MLENSKTAPFWKKWQGVSSSFWPKNENFQSSPFSLYNSPNMSHKLYDPRLFQKKDVRANVGISKTAPFSKKWQGVSSSFWPKNENFQSSPFSHHQHHDDYRLF